MIDQGQCHVCFATSVHLKYMSGSHICTLQIYVGIPHLYISNTCRDRTSVHLECMSGSPEVIKAVTTTINEQAPYVIHVSAKHVWLSFCTMATVPLPSPAIATLTLIIIAAFLCAQLTQEHMFWSFWVTCTLWPPRYLGPRRSCLHAWAKPWTEIIHEVVQTIDSVPGLETWYCHCR
jgi:hypothetical protein